MTFQSKIRALDIYYWLISLYYFNFNFNVLMLYKYQGSLSDTFACIFLLAYLWEKSLKIFRTTSLNRLLATNTSLHCFVVTKVKNSCYFFGMLLSNSLYLISSPLSKSNSKQIFILKFILFWNICICINLCRIVMIKSSLYGFERNFRNKCPKPGNPNK